MAKRAAAKLNQVNPREAGARRVDGWNNILTGIGNGAKDKRLGNKLSLDLYAQEFMEELWLSDDMAARIVETIPDEMCREGFEVQIEGDDGKDISEAIAARIDELELMSVLHEAECFQRAYGGAGILLGANDGATDLAEPLNLAKVKTFDWMTALTPRELIRHTVYDDPAAPRYGDPETYELRQDAHSLSNGERPSVIVHESRIIRFQGIRVSRRQLQLRNGWGESVLSRCVQLISDYQTSWASAATLLADFSQAVFKIKGLSDLVVNNESNVVTERAALVDLTRSVCRAVLIDADEDFERKTTPLGGLPEMLQQFSIRLAAAAKIPVTLLMGQSPAGLNATGESDIRGFYDTIAAEQRRSMQPKINRMLTVLFAAKDGPTKGSEPDNWIVSFNPLWQMSDLEQAELRNKQALTDIAYINAQVVTPEEIAASRFGGDGYSTETHLDTETRAALAAADLATPEPQLSPLPGAPGTAPPHVIGPTAGPAAHPGSIQPLIPGA